NERLEITGVGGISTADRVRGYLAAGARTVQLATAAMRDPAIGVKIRSEWGE
ncbi:MAG: Dihydroorotate dehydrogenase, partial [Armatimonadetes bacterium]|nr:Dihydroorotate dehydrogenase [Armatimonadota bacterium]